MKHFLGLIALLVLLSPLGCGDKLKNNDSTEPRVDASIEGEKLGDVSEGEHLADARKPTAPPPPSAPIIAGGSGGDKIDGGRAVDARDSASSGLPVGAPMDAPSAGAGFAPPAPGSGMELGGGVSPERNSDTIVADNTLTAGSFNDALNLDVFSNYWQSSSLANAAIAGLEQPNWKALIPEGTGSNYEQLDLTFVVDVTGSMGDELTYVQVEIDSIAQNIASLFPNIKQRYALVTYRDKGDEFVVKSYDFTENLRDFQKSLNEQRADGGGDLPEAMDQALAASLSLQWGTNEDHAKLIFLVADAPPHDEQIKQTFESVFALRDKKVRIYPVAASGVDDLAESVLRTSALLTGGQYIFLTDDSGIGNTHAEPKFPCYYVEKLKDVMVRTISDVLTGVRSEPALGQVLRTVGHPINGVCAEQ